MVSRRGFLTHSCQLGVATSTIGSTLMSLGFARQAAAAHHEGDYKALVCIMLAGGNDSYNMLVPYDADQYAEYQGIRSDLALSRDSLLTLPEFSNGRTYGLHPGMSAVQDLYLNGDLAILANVGTLLEPVDAAGIEAGTARVPVGLYSHSDQQAQWQTAVSYSRSATEGWVGRIADIQGPDLANGISMNVSLNGSNLLQSGRLAVPYSINPNGDGAPGIFSYANGTNYGNFRRDMIDSIFAGDHYSMLRSEYARRMRRAIQNQQDFVEAIRQSPPLDTTFGEDRFSQALAQIVRVIGARDAMGAKRQTFYVLIGGWDHHDEVLDNQARMLPIVAQGMADFRSALLELDVYDDVLTFTISDFARTLTSNGKGSDHGWGGHHMVMGGAVNGGVTYGTYPMLSMKSPLDTGRGVYVPTMSTEEYFAELALWFDVAPKDLDRVLPNVREFYSPGSPNLPLGFVTT